MPALITHHLFGEEAARRLPDTLLSNEEEKIAFLLGNQGPDPFLFRFRTLPKAATNCHRLGNRMHEEKVHQAFYSLRGAVVHLRESDKTIGRAFVLGLLAHYLLDSSVHPFIYAQEDAICSAGVGLENAHSEVHAIIESDLDSWMLWSLCGRTIEDTAPASMLVRTERIGLIASALLSQTALQVFSIKLNANEYANCVTDYELVCRIIEPAGSHVSQAISSIKRIERSYSILSALAHRVTTSDECAAANLEHKPWADPATGEWSDASFADIFQNTLDSWPAFAEDFVRADKDGLALLLGQRDYRGKPIEE